MRIKFFAATLLLAALPFSFVVGQSFRDLDITVSIHADGSADVVQKWDVSVNDGTEMYIPVENLGKMTISGFTVSENGVAYRNEGNRWNVDRSLSAKAGRCGIVEKGSGSYELCWGKGSYGDHVWTVSYRLGGLVQSLEDCDAFNFRFVNPDLSPLPQHVKVTFRNLSGSAWSEENTAFWGFGLAGDIWMDELSDPSNPSVIVESSEAFGRRSNVTVMMRFAKGIFSPVLSRDMSFDDMQKKAFKGSDYGDDNSGWWIGLLVFLGFLFFLVVLLYCVISSALGYKYKKSLFGTRKITGWWREAPFKGDIPASYFVLTKGNRFSTENLTNNVIGAYFLKWIMEGIIKVDSTDPSKDSKTNLVLLPGKENSISDSNERNLYNMVAAAAGSNQILEPKEFEKWSKRNYNKVASWPEKILTAGEYHLISNKLVGAGSLKAVSPDAAVELRHVIEFKNFLKDFTLSDQREAVDVGLWKDYLVFAQLLGIADKVAKQFKKLFPADFQKMAESLGTTDTVFMNSIYRTHYISSTSFSNAMNRKAAQQIRTSGGGGHTSFGGGGGFSGGGFGGGSR